MPEGNLVSITLSPEDKTAVLDAIEVIKTKLDPVLIALSKEERHQIAKMNDKTVAFVTKALDYTGTNPEFNPPYLNTGELSVDIKAVGDLTDIYRPINQITQKLDDTIMLSGSEAYVASLSYYNSVKQAAKLNIPAAKTIYDDLKARFVKSKTTTPPAE